MSERIDSPSSLAGSFPVAITLPIDVKKKEDEDTDGKVNNGKA